MKKFKKLFATIFAAAIMTSLFAGIYSVSAKTTLGYLKDIIDFSDCEEIDGGTIQIRKGGAKVIPSSLDAVFVEIEDESIGKLEATSCGPEYAVYGLENGTTKVKIVKFADYSKVEEYVAMARKCYIYTIEVSDEFPKELKPYNPDMKINMHYSVWYTYERGGGEVRHVSPESLGINDPYDDRADSDVISPVHLYDDKATWTSDNESVVTVKNGKVYPESLGTATVTALLEGVEYKWNVTVVSEIYVDNNTSTGSTAAVYNKGDITKDGKVGLKDVIEIAKYIIGKVQFSDAERNIADYNDDGQVGLQDVIGVAKHILNNNKK